MVSLNGLRESSGNSHVGCAEGLTLEAMKLHIPQASHFRTAAENPESCWSRRASAGDVTSLFSQLSSAYSLTVELGTYSGRSFINSRKRKQELPLGTPSFPGAVLEVQSCKTTVCY
jgi:hypothetical protein